MLGKDAVSNFHDVKKVMIKTQAAPTYIQRGGDGRNRMLRCFFDPMKPDVLRKQVNPF